MTAINIICLAIAALAIYYGCSRGFKAMQWEHRYREQAKQTRSVLIRNAEWSDLYHRTHDQLRGAMRELWLLRAGELADQVQREVEAKVTLLDAGDTEGGSHD